MSSKLQQYRSGAATMKDSRMLFILFTSLVVDLLAFTVILPLLPSVLDHFEQSEDGTYLLMKSGVSRFRNLVGAPDSPKWNSVLFGGIIGSLFSLLQFFSSPIIGALSDVHGRKPLMILTSVGIALSYAIWAFSESFTLFVLARIVGGISKGNVSLSTVIVGDVTTTENRNKGMATVGIAFSVGFLIGPLIGAWFSTQVAMQHSEASAFFYPAVYALILSVINIGFLVFYLDESLSVNNRLARFDISRVSSLVNPSALFNFSAVENISKADRQSLRKIGLIYFVYLLIYSGLEFTLTFLTHSRFSFNRMQQGKMFLFLGVIMIFIHGGVVRRVKSGNEIKNVFKAMFLLIPAFLIIGLASNQFVLFIGLAFFSYASAVVVPCMTAEISHYGSEDQKGTIMGIFRSLGALSRAVGPITASTIYWCLSPTLCYCIGAVCVLLPLILLANISSKIK